MENVQKATSGSSAVAAVSFLREIRNTLRFEVIMACISVQSERDAFRIFETLNDRGLTLSPPDLLLNFLMREAKPTTDRKTIRELWTDMVESMGKRDIHKFLRHLWVSRNGDIKSADLFTALKEHIEGSKINSLEFARSCAEECQSYVELITFDKSLGDSAKYVRRLLDDLDSQPCLPVLLSAYTCLRPADFLQICRYLLIFVTRYAVIADLDPSGLESVFYDLAKRIREMSGEINAGKKLPPIVGYVKHVLSKNSATDEQIQSAMPKLVFSPSDNQAQYVLERLANYMQCKTKEVVLGDETNIEHIFPKKPDERKWGGKSNHEVLEPFLWHIGNLTMFGKRLNTGAANDEFDIKSPQYLNSNLEMAKRVAKQYKEWSKENIVGRATLLTKYVLAVWDFDNPSRV